MERKIQLVEVVQKSMSEGELQKKAVKKEEEEEEETTQSLC